MKRKHSVTKTWDILQFKLKKSLDLDLKNTRIVLLDLDWFYNILDFNLKHTRNTLLDLDWFY